MGSFLFDTKDVMKLWHDSGDRIDQGLTRGFWILFCLGNPHQWIKSTPCWLYIMFVLVFFKSLSLRCWRLLIQSWEVFCMALDSSKEREIRLTSSKISNDVDGKPYSRWPQGDRSHVWMFSSCVKERSWVWIQNERLVVYYIAFYCPLYCILLSTGFTVRKLYYVSILFYYASVFDFPKYKKLYIALCYGRKYFLPRSIRISPQKRMLSEIGVISLFPWFDTPVGWRSPLTAS